MANINWSNVTDFQGVLAGANTNTDSWFWTFVLYGVWLVLMILFSVGGWEATLLISSFIGLILGLFLAYQDLVSWVWVLPLFATILFTILYIIWTAPKQQ